MKQTFGSRDQNNLHERPRVSVIIPAYNHEKYVGKAIASVLGQSFKNFELIVIDDGSTDSTLAEIKKTKDLRLKFYTQKNCGAARTINRGIQLSRGEFISILNSDDIYHPQRLSRLVSFMDEHPEYAMVATHLRAIDQRGNPLASDSAQHFWCDWYAKALACFYSEKEPFFSLLRHNYIVSTSNIFIRSAIFKDNLPFNDLLAYCHDYEFLLRIIGKYQFHMIEDVLLDYRIHEKNAIRENEFLKHLEVLYTIFNSINLAEILSKHGPEARVSTVLFQSLFKNPEINPEKYPSEFIAIIKEKNRDIGTLNREIEERGARLTQADEWLKKLQKSVENQKNRLIKADEQQKILKGEIVHREYNLQILNKKLEETTWKLKSNSLILNEIYNSKGWKWLTKYRGLKQKVNNSKIISWMTKGRKFFIGENEKPVVVRSIADFMMRGTRRLVFYRWIKQKIFGFKSEYSDFRNKLEIPDLYTQNIRIIHPVEKNRPVVIHAIANFMIGGSSRLVADLVEYIGHRYEQEVITFYAPSPPAFSGFPIHEFPRSVEKIADFLKQKKASMLHVHYWGDCDDPWYRQVFTAARKHSCIVVENINTPVETFTDEIIDFYVYVSDYARNFSSVKPERATVIYPGSNLDMYKRNGAPIADNVIGMVYRLEKDKLCEDSIQVFIDVIKRRPETKAVIVGGGSFLESYKRQTAEQGVEDSFEFAGYVPYQKLPEYYRRFSVFVAPVWKESFGQVSPFAMGMEIPVAGYEVGALSEILGSDECLGADREELINIIIRLLDNKEERIKIGKRNRNRAISHFSLRAMIAQYENLYDSLMNQKNRNN